MNSREFFTHALLSCHKVLMEATLPEDLPDEDDELDEEIMPIAAQVSKIAVLYSNELTIRWKARMEVEAQRDEEDQEANPSFKNLTKPPPDMPPSSNN